MKILGLVASRRVRGNTELMVKEALLGAQSLGAEVEILRLTDLKIEPCQGCMSCVFKQTPCSLPDDFNFLLNAMAKADGLILGAPIYFLGAPAIIKSILDRCLSIISGQFDGKKAVTLGVGGKTEWGRVFPSQLNLLPLIAGYQIIDHELFASAGPGEVLLNRSNPRRANEMGQILVEALSGQCQTPELLADHCPLCWDQNFRFVAADRVECPICFIQGEIVRHEDRVLLRFDHEELKFKFCGHASRAEHMEEWVKKTGPRFKEHARDILILRKPYENLRIPWLKPNKMPE